MTGFNSRFTITNRMTSAITQIERARDFWKPQDYPMTG